MDIDILIMGDNNLDTVGGEQESTKIILEGVNSVYKIGVVQPGKIKNKVQGIEYYEVSNEIRIKHIIKKPKSFLKYINNVRKIIKDKCPKIIHTQAQVSFFIISLLRFARLISKDIVVIHTERGLLLKYSKFFKAMFLISIKQLDILVTTTKFNMNCWKPFIDKYYDNKQYNVIENTAGKIFENYDESLEKDKNKIVLGFAGRYCGWKNWPLSEKIIDEVEKDLGNKFEVHMAVGCLDESSIKKTEDMFMRLERKLKNRFKGQININIEQMNKYYYDIDIFILTSKHNTESFGRTLVEAMSRKTIVLTTDAGGTVEVVGDKNLVCETAEDFKEKIINMYNNKDLMISGKNKNMDRIRTVYSLENNLNKHLIMYKKILNRGV